MALTIYMRAKPSLKANKMQSCKIPSRIVTWALNSQYSVMKTVKHNIHTYKHTIAISPPSLSSFLFPLHSQSYQGDNNVSSGWSINRIGKTKMTYKDNGKKKLVMWYQPLKCLTYSQQTNFINNIASFNMSL